MKKIISKLAIIGVSIMCFYSIISINAHSRFLDVTYDECKQEDEIWYYLNKGEIKYYNETNDGKPVKINSYYHLSQDTKTIKYYVADHNDYDSTITWKEDFYSNFFNEEIYFEYVNNIVNAYINSMKKWNNVYYYSYDANGNRIENKVINIVEGNKDDYNLIIHPGELENDWRASTGFQDRNPLIVETLPGNVRHIHCEHWSMQIDVYKMLQAYFDENSRNIRKKCRNC